MLIDLDFRLVELSHQLSALGELLDVLERQIEVLEKSAESDMKNRIKEDKLTPADVEWDMIRREFEYQTEFLLPCFLRGPFLVSLYAVYEAGVTEIARLIQRKQGTAISLNDLKGDFLERAKKYYKFVLCFSLNDNATAWQYIRKLCVIRNAIAHANGRLEMTNPKTRSQIKRLASERIGIDVHEDYVIADAAFTRRTCELVGNSLNDLIQRYKQWDGPAA